MDLSSISEKVLMVDPFLVEALQNPRHRLTILRMELDIQKFLQNQDLQLFEFPHFPTSYLRLAAHRVAQYYHLQTTVQDNGILVRKTVEAKFPPICLSQIPAKQLADNKPEHVKITIKPRPNKSSEDEASDCMVKQRLSRTVEQRKEEYDRARARIFSTHGSTATGSVDVLSHAIREGQDTSTNREGTEWCKLNDVEKYIRDAGTTSRVAILRDREKDLSDPDYDRSYTRYVNNLPINLSINFAPLTMQKTQPPQYYTGYHMPRNEVPLGYVCHSIPPLCAIGSNQTSRTAANVPWLNVVMPLPYTHTALQAPFCQQSLGYDHFAIPLNR